MINAQLPRLGFLGAGWIGRNRLSAVVQSASAEVSWICDSSAAALEQAQAFAPTARTTRRFEDLLDDSLDGIVIATPSGMHAEQCLQALDRGCAVFCQKPLGRNAREVKAILERARTCDRLLAVDLSYRFTAGMSRLKQLLQEGAVGTVFAADLVFHNGYGPDKPWFYQPALSGGGCVMDLGVHLVDLGLWALGFPKVVGVHSRLYHRGALLSDASEEVEDYAVAQVVVSTGVTLQVSCSWNLNVGRDAVIRATFHGTKGGLSFRNVSGSFYHFDLRQYSGTKQQILVSPPDEWGGRAILAWVNSLAAGNHFAPESEHLVCVAEALDAVYERKVEG